MWVQAVARALLERAGLLGAVRTAAQAKSSRSRTRAGRGGSVDSPRCARLLVRDNEGWEPCDEVNLPDLLEDT